MDFIKTQFDKILLSVLMLVMAAIVIAFVLWDVSATSLAWATGAFGAFLAALLTLITGSRFTPRSNERGNVNGNPQTNGNTAPPIPPTA